VQALNLALYQGAVLNDALGYSDLAV